MMVSMAALQVFVVRFFFQGARKGTLHLSSYLSRKEGKAELLTNARHLLPRAHFLSLFPSPLRLSLLVIGRTR